MIKDNNNILNNINKNKNNNNSKIYNNNKCKVVICKINNKNKKE